MSREVSKSVEVLDISAALRDRKPASFLPLGSRKNNDDERFKSTGIQGLVKVKPLEKEAEVLATEPSLEENSAISGQDSKSTDDLVEGSEEEADIKSAIASVETDVPKISDETSETNVLTKTNEPQSSDTGPTEVSEDKTASLEASLIEKEKLLEDKINALEIITNECGRTIEELGTNLEKVVLDAILRLSKDLVRQEISEQPAILVNKIKALVKEIIENVESAKIFLAQADMDLLHDDFKQFNEKIVFDVDDSLSSGEVLLRTENIELFDSFASRTQKK